MLNVFNFFGGFRAEHNRAIAGNENVILDSYGNIELFDIQSRLYSKDHSIAKRSRLRYERRIMDVNAQKMGNMMWVIFAHFGATNWFLEVFLEAFMKQGKSLSLELG